MTAIRCLAFLAGLGTLGGCVRVDWNPGEPDSGAPPEDTTCPIITHDPVARAQEAGRAVSIEAVVTDGAGPDGLAGPDESGVYQVRVFFKTEVTTTWASAVLSPMDAEGRYGGTIPGSAVTSGGMDYYLFATDWRANGCTMPDGGERDPWHFRVTADR